MTIIRFDSLESTNRYCEALDLNQVEDFTCYWALQQTAGIGQRGNHWESSSGLNLTFSLVLHPDFLPASEQFRLTQMLSLALSDCLRSLDLPKPIHIKWPNDIYVGNDKICGILVSNRLQGEHITASICGIGLNVNQTDFPSWVPNPVSLLSLTGKQFELEALLQQLLDHIAQRYHSLRLGNNLLPEYLVQLLRIGIPAEYRYRGCTISATIKGVDPFGHLLLVDEANRELVCGMKEISYI